MLLNKKVGTNQSREHLVCGIKLSFGVKCILDHLENMFYSAVATIVMHNMMVEERIGNEERESKNFYDVGDKQSIMASSEDEANSSNEGDQVDNTLGNFDLSSVRESTMKYTIVKQCWKKLYSKETSLRLQDAVKNFVFKKHNGDDGSLDIHEKDEEYDPLTY